MQDVSKPPMESQHVGCLYMQGIQGILGMCETLRLKTEELRNAYPIKGLYWEPQIGNPKNIAGI